MYMYTVCHSKWTCDTEEALLCKWPCQEDGSEDKGSDPDDETVVKTTHAVVRLSVQLYSDTPCSYEKGLSGAHNTVLGKCAD